MTWRSSSGELAAGLQSGSIAMLGPESFRERGFRFALTILREYHLLLRTTDVPRHLATQMLRSGTAVGANLEEAKSASSRRDLIAKNAIALREARECHYWLRLICADQPDCRDRMGVALDECWQLIAVLTVAVRRLRSCNTTGEPIPRANTRIRPDSR